MRTNYHDEDANDTNLKPPTSVKHTNEQLDTETLTGDVLVRKYQNKRKGGRRPTGQYGKWQYNDDISKSICS